MAGEVSAEVAATDHDLEEVARIRDAVWPDARSTPPDLRHTCDAFGGVYFLARANRGAPVAYAFVGLLPGTSAESYAYADVTVLPDARCRGTGSLLHRLVSQWAAARGKRELQVRAMDDDADTSSFLARRAYRVVDRQKRVSLDLERYEAASAPVAPPPGVTLVSRADRPDVVAGMYAVACEAAQDRRHGRAPIV